MTPPASIDPAFCAEAFSLTPDPRRLFFSRDHAEALAGLRLGIEYRRGLMVVVGEVGMGKTTIAYSLLATLGEDVRTAYVANTRLPFDALLRRLLEDFGVTRAEADRAALLGALQEVLLKCAARDQVAVLVIDEAQSLDDETFESLRLLSNVETYSQKLLQIVLIGQPELDARLRRPQLRQIADRVAIRVNLNPLDRAESRLYIAHRLERAGGSLEMFTRPALDLIMRSAHGVPRRMNILCHNALLQAYAVGATRVTWWHAREAVRELRGGRLIRLPRRASVRGQTRSEHRRLAPWAAAAGVMAVGGLALAAGWMQGTAPRPPSAVGTIAASLPPLRAAEPIARTGTVPLAAAAHAAARLEAEEGAPGGPAAGAEARDGGSATSEAAAAPPALAVTVGPGSTLTSIARRFYGSNGPQVIRKIVDANPGITDPDFILVGSKLVIPDGHDGGAGDLAPGREREEDVRR